MFKFNLEIETSPNYLITKRMINNSMIAILSAILGSVSGLLAIFGKTMKISETSFAKLKEKIAFKAKFQKLKETRKNLLMRNESSKDKVIDLDARNTKIY